MTEAFELPTLPGAYALLVTLPRAAVLPIARLRRPRLAAGTYIYCGSARGPGGLAARVGRHLRRDKPLRWHIDHLTSRGSVRDVLCLPDGSECELVRRFQVSPQAGIPIPGFGSSDCRGCAAHLLSVPAGFSLTAQKT